MSFSEVSSQFADSVNVVASRVPSPEQVESLVKLLGKVDAMTYVVKQQELFGRYLTGVNRASLSVSSDRSSACDRSIVPRFFSGYRNVSPRARLAKLQSMPSWRRSPHIPDGLCYTRLFKPGAVEKEAMTLSEWPTLGRLLATGWSSFKSVDELSGEVSVDFDAETGMAHVRGDSSGRYSFVQLASAVAVQNSQKVGSLGAVLKASCPGSGFELPAGFRSSVRFGGSTVSSDVGKLATSSSEVKLLGWKLGSDDVVRVNLGVEVEKCRQSKDGSFVLESVSVKADVFSGQRDERGLRPLVREREGHRGRQYDVSLAGVFSSVLQCHVSYRGEFVVKVSEHQFEGAVLPGSGGQSVTGVGKYLTVRDGIHQSAPVEEVYAVRCPVRGLTSGVVPCGVQVEVECLHGESKGRRQLVSVSTGGRVAFTDAWVNFTLTYENGGLNLRDFE